MATKSEEQQELQELLRKLLQSVYSICVEGLEKKRFEPEKEQYFKQKIDGFHYGDTGVHIESWQPEEVLKNVWYKAASIVGEEVKKLGLYTEIFERLTPIYNVKWESLDYHVPSLDYILSKPIRLISRKTLDGEITSKSSLEPYITSFLKYLNHEDGKYKLIAQLSGIILQPQSIQLDTKTLLRKPTLEDIEVEYPAASFFLAGDKLFNPPAAIIELTGVSSSSLQKDIYRAISILHLFKVGGIEYSKYIVYSESPFVASGISSSEKIHLTKSGSYLVKNEDLKPLKEFWTNMKKVEMPSTVYPGTQKEPDELSIAYDRYSDSLEVGIIEKRISSAVMGLEALYLGEDPKEKGELRYKLSMRVGKLLSLIGYDPSGVKERTRDAYDIRSTYVHGGTLKQRGRQKYEKKYGDLNEFCKTIIDYLRTSIVALLLRKTSKNSLIQKIDDSFLDNKKEEEIKKILFMPYG